MAALWSCAAAAAARVRYHDRRTASVIGGVVFSHWLLDFWAHAPDLPLGLAGSRTVGLGLEYSADGEIHMARGLAVEVGLLAAGIGIYALGLRHRPGWRGR
jgi:hypothetical protein